MIHANELNANQKVQIDRPHCSLLAQNAHQITTYIISITSAAGLEDTTGLPQMIKYLKKRLGIVSGLEA